MVTFTFLNGIDHTVNLGIGLSEENVDALKAGQPLVFKVVDLNLADRLNGEIIIYSGRDDTDLKEQVRDFFGTNFD